MDTLTFKRALRADLQSLWDHIEAESGGTISVRSVVPPRGARMGCDPDNFPNLGLLRVPDAPVSDAAALHELLHLRRYIVDGVPRIHARGEYHEVGGHLDNTLEHLTIIPSQASWGLREEERWNQGCADIWDTQEAKSHYPYTTQQFTKLASLTSFICTDPEINDRGERILRAMFHPASITEFRESVQAKLNDKQSLSRFVVSALGLPRSEFALYDCRSRSYRTLTGTTL